MVELTHQNKWKVKMILYKSKPSYYSIYVKVRDSEANEPNLAIDVRNMCHTWFAA